MSAAPDQMQRLPRENLVRAMPRGSVELRDAGDGAMPTMAGHFAVFDEWTRIDSMFEGTFMERIAPGSFRKTFAENRDQIKVTFNHGHDPSLGDKVLGPIETLAEDRTGASYEIPLLDTTYNRELLPGLEAGLYGSSFRFRVMREEIQEEPGTSDHNPDGLPERTIKEAQVFEFGPVTFPAYAGATAGVRSLTDELIFDGFTHDPKRLVELIDNTRALTLKSLKGDPEPAPEPAPAETTPEPVSVEPETTSKEDAVGVDIERFATMDDLIARQKEVQAELEAISAEYGARALDTETQARFDGLGEEKTALSERVKDVERRLSIVADGGGGIEEPVAPKPTTDRVRPGARKPENIYDMTWYRQTARDAEDEAMLVRDGARRSVDQAVFPVNKVGRETLQEGVERLLSHDDEKSFIARRILQTGSERYMRAFGKSLIGQFLTSEEERALSLTTTAGGFAVPYVLDPSIIPTSNSSVNPFRAISRVIPITVDDWKGVSSAGITAAFAAEATETTDNAPTLAQPAISTEKAQAFVPYSIEIGMDWSGLLTEMAALLQDAKDDLEATKFTLGTGTNEPFGLIVGATTLTITTTTGAFVIADLYKVEEALPPRHRPRASIVGNRFVFNKIRQFDTSGGSGVWMDGLQPGLANLAPVATQTLGPRILGYPAYENSAMDAVLTTGSEIAVIGDFSRFVIIDRVGLNVELIPHLVSTNHRPTGQRGLYAYWRTGSKVVDAGAFRTLQT